MDSLHVHTLVGYTKHEFFNRVLPDFLCEVDPSRSGGEGILLTNHTKTTPIRAPERCAI
jgi:hypothetical protein